MKRLILVFGIALAIAGAVVLAAQQNPPQTGAQQAPPGRIQGVVVRDGTTTPIAGVQISLNAGPGGALAPAISTQTLLDSLSAQGLPISEAVIQAATNALNTAGVRGGNNPNVLTATTDASGRFVLENVPAGSRAVMAQLEGYFGPSRNGASPGFVMTNVTVAPQQTTDVKISMVPGGAIGGRVFDSNGQALSDAQVQVLRLTYTDGSPTLQPVNTKTSDDRGEYRLYRLAPGDYYLAASPRPRFGARGNPAQAALPVKTFYGDVTEVGRSQPLHIKGGEDLSGVNVSLQLETGASVSGRVSSILPLTAQVTAANGQVRTINANTATLMLYPSDKTAIAEANAGTRVVSLVAPNSGAFKIENALPGVYDLFASAPDATGFGPAAPPGQATQPVGYGRTTVDVRKSDVDGVALTIHPGVALRGRVTVDGAVSTTVNARISLQSDDSASRIPVYQQVGRFVPVVDDMGQFAIPSVPEGRYRFRVNFSATPVQTFARGRGQAVPQAPATQGNSAIANAYVQDIRLQGSSVYDNGLNVDTSPIDDVQVLVRTDGGSIQGTLLTADRKPVAATTVALVPADSRRQNGALYKTTVSNGMGVFTFTGVAPGQYTMYSWEDLIPGAYQNPDYLRRYEGRGTAVVVAPSARTNADVRLIPIG